MEVYVLNLLYPNRCLWVEDQLICTHGYPISYAKLVNRTGVGKTSYGGSIGQKAEVVKDELSNIQGYVPLDGKFDDGSIPGDITHVTYQKESSADKCVPCTGCCIEAGDKEVDDVPIGNLPPGPWDGQSMQNILIIRGLIDICIVTNIRDVLQAKEGVDRVPVIGHPLISNKTCVVLDIKVYIKLPHHCDEGRLRLSIEQPTVALLDDFQVLPT